MKISSLDNFFLKFPQFRIATRDDNDELLSFFNSTSMQTSATQIHYLREPDFFKFLELSSDKYFVFINSDGPIRFIGTLTLRSGYINGQLGQIAYLGDLRSKLGIKMSTIWKNALAELIINIKNIQEFNADIILTAMMKDNQKAKLALHNSSNKFFYHKLCNYEMVNLLSPLIFKSHDAVAVAFEADSIELDHFITTQGSRKMFGHTAEFQKKLKGKNIVVRQTGQIIAYAKLFSPSPFKDILLIKLPKILQLLNRAASLMTKVPQIGSKMDIQYLNFLTFDLNTNQAKILQSMISFLKLNNIFSHCDFVSWPSFDVNPLKSSYLLKDSAKLELYEVSSQDKPSLVLHDAPAFEISLV